MAKVTASDTVMRLLAARRHVRTTYGGGFVQSIDGLAGTRSGRRDWFYYVNGSEAGVGAADFTLRPGDAVQWDYHRWNATIHVPAIVGAYPKPFTLDPAGHRPRTVVECAAPACATVARRLSAAGASVSRAPLGAPVGGDDVLVVVAPWSAARRVGALRPLLAGPSVSGVFARFAASGRLLSLLDGGGATATAAPPGSGLVAATQASGGTLAWAIVGTDDAGVARAAAALDAGKLRDAFAVAALPHAQLKVPVAR